MDVQIQNTMAVWDGDLLLTEGNTTPCLQVKKHNSLFHCYASFRLAIKQTGIFAVAVMVKWESVTTQRSLVTVCSQQCRRKWCGKNLSDQLQRVCHTTHFHKTVEKDIDSAFAKPKVIN